MINFNVCARGTTARAFNARAGKAFARARKRGARKARANFVLRVRPTYARARKHHSTTLSENTRITVYLQYTFNCFYFNDIVRQKTCIISKIFLILGYQ